MTVKRGTCQVLLCLTVAVGIGLVLATPGRAETTFDRQLAERSKSYLESVPTPTARDLAQRGLAKLNRPTDLARTRRLPEAEPHAAVRSLQKLNGWQDNPGILRAIAFLRSNFRQPSELEVAVRVALPSHFDWERQFGVLAAYRPSTGPVFRVSAFLSVGCDALIAAPPRDAKMLALLLGLTGDATLPEQVDDAGFRLAGEQNILARFPRLVQTTVLLI